jgi:uncharacterized membrane protein (UPF0127 family)
MNRSTTAARIAVLCLSVMLSGAAFALDEGDAEPLTNFPTSQLQLASGGSLHKFRVWVADTPLRRSQGLMFVRELATDQGMLFLFDPPRFASFWMQNTYLSLDLLFVAADGRIVNIIENATPLSTRPLESDAPVRAVLEVAAGTVQKLSLKPGDRLIHAAFVIRPKGSG